MAIRLATRMVVWYSVLYEYAKKVKRRRNKVQQQDRSKMGRNKDAYSAGCKLHCLFNLCKDYQFGVYIVLDVLLPSESAAGL